MPPLSAVVMISEYSFYCHYFRTQYDIRKSPGALLLYFSAEECGSLELSYIHLPVFCSRPCSHSTVLPSSIFCLAVLLTSSCMFRLPSDIDTVTLVYVCTANNAKIIYTISYVSTGIQGRIKTRKNSSGLFLSDDIVCTIFAFWEPLGQRQFHIGPGETCCHNVLRGQNNTKDGLGALSG